VHTAGYTIYFLQSDSHTWCQNSTEATRAALFSDRGLMVHLNGAGWLSEGHQSAPTKKTQPETHLMVPSEYLISGSTTFPDSSTYFPISNTANDMAQVNHTDVCARLSPGPGQ
jgi:hypothetical protein